MLTQEQNIYSTYAMFSYMFMAISTLMFYYWSIENSGNYTALAIPVTITVLTILFLFKKNNYCKQQVGLKIVDLDYLVFLLSSFIILFIGENIDIDVWIVTAVAISILSLYSFIFTKYIFKEWNRILFG